MTEDDSKAAEEAKTEGQADEQPTSVEIRQMGAAMRHAAVVQRYGPQYVVRAGVAIGMAAMDKGRHPGQTEAAKAAQNLVLEIIVLCALEGVQLDDVIAYTVEEWNRLDELREQMVAMQSPAKGSA